MAKVKNGSSAEIEQISENLTETPNVENTPHVEETPQPENVEETPQPTRETLNDAFVKAKLNLRHLEDINNFDTNHPDVKAAEIVALKAKNLLKAFDDENAKYALKLEMEQKMFDAKETLKSRLFLGDDEINALLTSDDKAKGELKWAFNFVFGAPELNVKMGATGKSLTKPSQNGGDVNKTPTNGENVNDVVKSLMDAGMTHNEMLNLGHSDGRLRNVSYKIDYAKDKLTGKYAPRVR